MKKNLLLFTATGVLMTSTVTTFTGCTKEEDAPVKNYFGVEPEGNGTPKEAYYALFGGVVVVFILIVYGLKKIRK